jgi:hypothetical protein
VRPGALLALGLLVGAGLTVLLFLQQLVLGRTPFGEPGLWSDVWVAVIHALVAAYVPAALYATVRAAGENPTAAVVSAGGRHPAAGPAPALVIAALAGILLGLLGPWLTEPHLGRPFDFWQVANWAPEVYWHRILGLWILTWFACWAVVIVRIARAYARSAEAVAPIDLFDRAAVAPFVRQGLFQMLSVAGAVALLGLLGLDEGITWMLLLFGGSGVLLVAVAGVLPLRAAQQLRGSARAAELEWCDAGIRAEREALREMSSARPGRLADLIAYRDLVSAVSPWPVELTVMRRVILYLFIPLLSWILGAIVQELVVEVWRGPEPPL